MQNIVASGVALVTYVCLSWFVLKVEGDYAALHEDPRPSWRERWLSLGLGAFTLTALLAVVEPSRIWEVCLWSGLVATLRGVWVVDARYHLIPDRLQILGTLCVLGLAVSQSLLVEDSMAFWMERAYGLGAVLLLWALGALYERLRGHVGLGFGDVKLLAWLSLYFGMQLYPLIFLAALLQLVWFCGIFLHQCLRQRQLIGLSLQSSQAFGPMLVLASALQVFLQFLL